MGGRVVEGARLESVYRVKNSIEGSNPSPSAIKFANKFTIEDRFRDLNQYLKPYQSLSSLSPLWFRHMI